MALNNVKLPDKAVVERASRNIERVMNELNRILVGRPELHKLVVTGILSQGHILLEGLPGVGKTALIKTLGELFGLKFSRVQFTPDLMPGDILGSHILQQSEDGSRQMTFQPGPIFTNILLADEINRASPRTQSALLEAMQELSCTVSGKNYPIELPFMVFATQNPYESEGTYYLPEAQLDRFMIHSLIDYPDKASEETMLKKFNEDLLFKGERRNIVKKEDIIEIFSLVPQIQIDEILIKAINELVRSSRPKDESFNQELKDMVSYGVSPRGSLSLMKAAKVFAMMEGEESVRWKHIVRMAPCALRHRIKLSSFARREGISEDDVVTKLLKGIEHKYNFILKE